MVLNQQGQPTPLKERGFSVIGSRMNEAISNLEEAIGQLDGAFRPVLTIEPPQGNSVDKKAVESSSEYIGVMNGYIERIISASSYVRNICRRSEI